MSCFPCKVYYSWVWENVSAPDSRLLLQRHDQEVTGDPGIGFPHHRSTHLHHQDGWRLLLHLCLDLHPCYVLGRLVLGCFVCSVLKHRTPVLLEFHGETRHKLKRSVWRMLHVACMVVLACQSNWHWSLIKSSTACIHLTHQDGCFSCWWQSMLTTSHHCLTASHLCRKGS